MARSRQLKGFLGAYTSRNHDFHRFWALGVVAGTGLQRVSLRMVPRGTLPAGALPVLRALEHKAEETWAEQLARQRIPADFVSSASLVLQRQDASRVDPQTRKPMTRWRAVARVSSIRGRTFQAERLLWIWPDPLPPELESEGANL